MQDSSSSLRASKLLLSILYVLTLSLLLYYLWDGFDYYLMPFMERPHHIDHQIIRPAGIRGHGLGVLGTLMMIILLSYSLRKRNMIFGNWGVLSTWLDFHIFLGIMGPLFIILHTSFKLNGIVAISFWSMIAVALSGVFGRYLYLQIPRNISGQEVGFKDLEETNKRLTQDIISTYNIDEEQITRIEQMIVGDTDPEKSMMRILISLVITDITRFFRMRIAKQIIIHGTDISKNQANILVNIARKKAILHRRIILLNKIHQLFYYWHVIHKPFAIVMYIIMIIHVLLTVVLGYKWIF